MQVAEQEVKSTSIQDVEILIDKLHVITERTKPIPFSMYKADIWVDGHAITDKVRFSNQILDLQTPTSQAVFHLQSAVCRAFRGFLDDNGFLEIHFTEAARRSHRRWFRSVQARLFWPTCLPGSKSAMSKADVCLSRLCRACLRASKRRSRLGPDYRLF